MSKDVKLSFHDGSILITLVVSEPIWAQIRTALLEQTIRRGTMVFLHDGLEPTWDRLENGSVIDVLLENDDEDMRTHVRNEGLNEAYFRFCGDMAIPAEIASTEVRDPLPQRQRRRR